MTPSNRGKAIVPKSVPIKRIALTSKRELNLKFFRLKIVNKSLEVVFFVDFFEFDVGSDAAVDYCAESIIGGDLVELDLLVF